ncbi:MAG: hypothetical protein ACLFSQ_03015 [Candidatus Zixiibacteriota bacterium]
MMDKILLISYYWPPSGGVVVRRILALCKYLPKFGFEPILLTASGKNPWIFLDHSMEVPDIEIHKIPAGDLEILFSEGRTPISVRLQTAFRALYNIDYMHKWQKKAAIKAQEIIQQNNINKVLITVPPLSLLRIAKKIKSTTPKVKIIGDFRDLFYSLRNDNPIQKIRRKISLPKVYSAMEFFDHLVGASPGFEEDLKKINSNVNTVTNGFDFEIASDKDYKKGNNFKIVYTGSFPSTGQNASLILNIFANLFEENKEFRESTMLEFAGLDYNFIYANAPILEHFQENIYAPGMLEHKEAVKMQKQADINLLILTLPGDLAGDSVIPAKIFEYIAARKPILAICNENSVIDKMIKKDNLGFSAPLDTKEIKETVLDIFDRWKNNNLDNQISEETAKKYHFENRIRQYSEILRKVH